MQNRDLKGRPIKYKNCRRLNLEDASSNAQHNVPHRKFIRINYVSHPNQEKVEDVNIDSDNSKTSSYKYAVYKKLNGSNKIVTLADSRSCSNNVTMASIDSKPEKSKSAPPESRIRNEKGTWDVRIENADRRMQRSLAAGVKTRASRIEKIEKIRDAAKKNTVVITHANRSDLSKQPSNTSASVPDANSNYKTKGQNDTAAANDIARISQMFEQVRRCEPVHGADEDKINRTCLSVAANGGNIKRLVDNFENKCNCKASTGSASLSNSSIATSIIEDVDGSRKKERKLRFEYKNSQSAQSRMDAIKNRANLKAKENFNIKPPTVNYIHNDDRSCELKMSIDDQQQHNRYYRNQNRRYRQCETNKLVVKEIVEQNSTADVDHSIRNESQVIKSLLEGNNLSDSSDMPLRRKNKNRRQPLFFVDESKSGKRTIFDSQLELLKELSDKSQNELEAHKGITSNVTINCHIPKQPPMSACDRAKINDIVAKKHNIVSCRKQEEIVGSMEKGKFQEDASDKLKEIRESVLHDNRCGDINDLRNFSGKNIVKTTTDDMLLLSQKNLNNSILPNPKAKVDLDVNLRYNENRKYNDLKSSSPNQNQNQLASPSHCVKIYVRNSTGSTGSKGSVTSDTCSSTDSDKDYDYYDNVAESITSNVCEVALRKKPQIEDLEQLRPKLGCDGAIFWNNCYFYDDNQSQCLNCDGLGSPTKVRRSPTRFLCICAKRKSDVHETRPRSLESVIDSSLSMNGADTGSSPDSDISSQHLQSQIDSESRRLKRGHVLTELLETERIYVSEMSSILKGYRNQMISEDLAGLVPPSLQGKEDILFGNLHELYAFHNDVFLKDLENCISTTELVALCFVQRRDTFYRLYSFYCQNIPRSERLRETLVDAHLFLQECQRRLGHKLPLAAYLLKPVQRITKYQLLLKDLLRFSDSGACAKELQKALDCMLIVLKCVNDSMHQIAITGFPADLSQEGELLLQDSFQVWTESKKDIRLRLKAQQRHIFLYQKAMLFCKQGSKTGHNKSTYQFKHCLKMSQIGLTESVRGDPKRFEVWLQGRQEVHTLQATTVEIKHKWVTDIKRVLLNQLEELKGEKIKQYGLNHKTLRQTVSWDTPAPGLSTPQRTLSCDTNETNKTLNGGDECPSHTAGICSSSSERDTQDVCGWSSDYSNSEDELSIIEDNSTPGSRFVALADYCAVGHSEVSMKEGDYVELLKIGCAGWWFVKVLETNLEGWTPAAYLEPFNRKSSRSSSRNQ